jgi:hypothetical protein
MNAKNSLNRISKINPTFDNSHWQLYDTMPGHKGVIRELNAQLKKCYNSGRTRTETRISMTTLMSKYSNFGAYDTEPCDFLDYILDKIYS